MEMVKCYISSESSVQNVLEVWQAKIDKKSGSTKKYEAVLG